MGKTFRTQPDLIVMSCLEFGSLIDQWVWLVGLVIDWLIDGGQLIDRLIELSSPQFSGKPVIKTHLKFVIKMVIICTGMKNALVGLLLICWFPSSGLASSCKPASSSIRGKVLKNHIIKTGSAERIDGCFKQCMGHSGCHSINFYLEERLCELNDQTHASHPEYMKEEPLGNYMVNDFRPATNTPTAKTISFACQQWLVEISTIDW